ncbi:DNA-binding protein [Pseudomonas agarici]|uniref:DNA-binding protein n=1 Tax=Pseudomonas agarici TaxID=46677 RepID=UPI0015A11E0B|nr:DNA-binding protein [Pseudomonas agarici]NWB91626.1 DNA-binding protein [Pseudomonas agarici]
MPAPLTPEQVRAALDRKGISIAEFCRQHGLNKNLVSDLLNGRKKGRYGEAHRAAVLLGIKEGVITASSTEFVRYNPWSQGETRT